MRKTFSSAMLGALAFAATAVPGFSLPAPRLGYGLPGALIGRRWSRSTVAQAKRAAIKARNRVRNKRK